MSYPEVQGKLTLPRIDDTKDGMGINNINPLNADLNPICHLLALLGAHHIFHVSRIRVKRPRRVVDHPPHLATRLIKSRAIPLLHLCVFVSCYRMNFTFTLPFICVLTSVFCTNAASLLRSITSNVACLAVPHFSA